ncbi:MAG: type II toxin-antitoxin system RelE/ParE family toxin [Acidipropionibacterium sp.]|jgi:plasmid stabilization system protein ParE|nr:type II toxin-antitoxin system RelE/ParE family toxin [Acidipropionibacterium sp.]
MTMLPWREHPAARAELVDAIGWYEERQSGLGERLNAELMEHVAFAREWPDAAPFYRNRQRHLLLRRRSVEGFPYGIVYLVRDNEVIVVAYAHEKRRPGYWRSRLRDL